MKSNQNKQTKKLKPKQPVKKYIHIKKTKK